MALFEWNDSYSVKVAEFDGQHQKLIGMLNELHEAMSVGKGKDLLGDILSRLVDYTRTHFAAEEALMRQFGYPRYAEHKKVHDDLVQQTLKMRESVLAGEAILTQEVMRFLRDWLAHHIQGMDKEYSQFFNSKGVH